MWVAKQNRRDEHYALVVSYHPSDFRATTAKQNQIFTLQDTSNSLGLTTSTSSQHRSNHLEATLRHLTLCFAKNCYAIVAQRIVMPPPVSPLHHKCRPKANSNHETSAPPNTTTDEPWTPNSHTNQGHLLPSLATHQHHKPSSVSRRDASREDVTLMAPLTLIHKWTIFSPRDFSCDM
jgi:hypothetical protein